MSSTRALPASISFLGARMHPWTMNETVDDIARRMNSGAFTQHVVVNVAKVVNMRHDADLRDAVSACDIINIDGVGLVWGARLLGFHVPERVAGIDLFFRLLDLAAERQETVYLLGAKEDIIEKTVETLSRRLPDLKFAGFHHGYFWDDEEAVVKDIANSGATMLFVAITSPKKEQFIHNWRDKLGVKFAMGVGGAFDIVAGKIRRAPVWMQRAGLEWLYRVLQEPGRLWKRYLITNGKFGLLILRARIFGK